MDNRHLIKLKCRSGTQFHLGESTSFEDSVLHKSSEIIHSDTLFSALVCIAAKIGIPNPEKILGKGLISSCFYVMEKEKSNLFFLPRPTVPLFGEMPFKAIKKIKYVSLGVFKSGIPVFSWFAKAKNQDKLHDDLIVGNNWIATKKEFEEMNIEFSQAKKLQLYQLQTLPQVRVHTDEDENNLYQVERLQIQDNSLIDEKLEIHFYFLFDGELTNNLKTVLHLLQDEGLGGQRSIGFGLFSDVEIISGTEIFSLKGTTYMNLSLLSPLKNNENDDFSELKESYYQTILRGGRNLASNWYLKQVLMLKEGAIISNKIKGNIVDISIGNDGLNLRYGKSFPLLIPEIV